MTDLTAGATEGAEVPGVQTHRLKPNSLGVLGILFFVFSGQAPLTGIAGAVPIAIVIGNGAGVPTAYIAAGVIILVFSIGFVAMGRHVVHAGAFYAYIGKGLGETTGVSGALVALFAYNTIQAAMYGLYGVVVEGIFVKHFSIDLPWWFWALATMAIVQILGTLGIDIGARCWPCSWRPSSASCPSSRSSPSSRAAAPRGWELPTRSASAQPPQEPPASRSCSPSLDVRLRGNRHLRRGGSRAPQDGPAGDVPLGPDHHRLLRFVTWMLVAFYGPSNVVDDAGKALEAGNGATFVFDAVGAQLGSWTGDVLEVLLATSLFAGILAFHNSITRYLFSLSRDRVIPRSVSRLNQRHSPWVAGAVQTGIVLLLTMPFAILGKDPVLTLFSWFSGVAVLGMMLLYFMTSISVVVFFRRTPSESSLARTLVAPVVGSIGIGIAVWLILDNFQTLIGGSATTAFWLGITVPIIAIAGAVLGWARRNVISRELID